MKNLKLIALFLLFTTFWSCELIFDDNIENNSIRLVSPGENDTNDFSSQFFLWEEDEDIETYRFQIVSPNFTTPSRIFEDTLITGTNLEIELFPETYQWRVRGENSVQNLSPYSTRDLLVDTNRDLSLEMVNLLSPDNGERLAMSQEIILRWERIPLATNYLVQFGSITTQAPSSFLDSTNENEIIIPQDELFQFEDNQTPFDVTYTWRVQAQNAESQTEFTPVRSFVIEAPEFNNN